MLKAWRPLLLEANASAESAREKLIPPCAMENPLHISGRTFIFKVQNPSPISRHSIPSHWLNRSFSIMPRRISLGVFILFTFKYGFSFFHKSFYTFSKIFTLGSCHLKLVFQL